MKKWVLAIAFSISPAPTLKASRLISQYRVTDVYRKIKGNWLIVREHVSVPVDLNTGKPDLSSKP